MAKYSTANLKNLTLKERSHLRYNLEQDFELFVKYIFRELYGEKFILKSFHSKICKTLEKVYKGEIIHLIINIPPQYGKTTLLGLFICWCYAKNKNCDFIYTAFGDFIVNKSSDFIKSIIKSHTFQILWGYEIEKTIDSKSLWKFKDGGSFLAMQMGGTITSFGAGSVSKEGFYGCICIDDPTKPADALSEVMRQRPINYYKNTLSSRRRQKGITPIVLIMQRLHEEDLTGYFLEQEKQMDWVLLKIPVFDEEGEPIWSGKDSKEELEKEQKSNAFEFAGQYMQEPAPLEGGIFKSKWLYYYDTLPKPQYRCLYADTAVKDGKQNDYSVFQCWGYGIDNKAYLIDQIRGKWLLPELLEKAKIFWTRHYNQKDLGNIRKFAIEDKSSGSGLIQLLRKMTNMPITLLKPQKDKVSRANDATPRFEAEQVILPKNAYWLGEYLHELLVFPNGKHDDQVDATTYAINDLFSHNIITNTGFSI